MNVMLFERRLQALIEECGGILIAAVDIKLTGRSQREAFIPSERSHAGLDMINAVRTVQPVRISFSIEVQKVSAWHHMSGDDRRLHPDLQRNQIGINNHAQS